MLNFKMGNSSLSGIISLLGLAYLVQFAAFIMNHVYRLRHEGRVCAGSFLTEEEWKDEKVLENYLDSRASFLWGWLVANWVLIGLACLGCCVVVGLAFKK